jgi:hypothetical protein
MRRILLAASIPIPNFLAKVAESSSPLSLVYEFTKYTFTYVVVARQCNSASRVPSSKTAEISCNFAEVLLYLEVINLISTSFWWSDQTWRRLGCKSPKIFRFIHESVTPASWSWKVLAEGSYSGVSNVNSYLSQVSNSSWDGLKVGKQDTTPCKSKGITKTSSTLSPLTLMECERLVGFKH